MGVKSLWDKPTGKKPRSQAPKQARQPGIDAFSSAKWSKSGWRRSRNSAHGV